MRVRALIITGSALVAAVIVVLVILYATDVFRIGHPTSTASYTSKAELDAHWDKTAPWLPDDATDIRIKEVKQYGPKFDPATLRATSHSALDPAQCTQAKRTTSPVLTASWSPDKLPTTVYRCGSWDVIATTNGWYGWTPNQ